RTVIVRSVTLLVVSVLLALAVQTAALTTAWFLLPHDLLTENLLLIATKTVWMSIVAAGFAHIGALLCVLSRSPLTALALLLIIPWIIEPVATQLIELVPHLQWASKASLYLPFQLISAPLQQSLTASWGTDE